MNLEKYTKGNGNFLIWILLIILVLGFGKYKNTLGLNFIQSGGAEERGSRRHNKGDSTYIKKGQGAYGALFGGKTFTAGSNIMGGNGLFILIVIALLFLCKDKKNDVYEEPAINVESEEITED